MRLSRCEWSERLALCGLCVSGLGIATSVPLVYVGYVITAISMLLSPGRIRVCAIGWKWASALSCWMLISSLMSPYAQRGLPAFAYAWPAMLVWSHAIARGGVQNVIVALIAAACGAGAAAILAVAQFVYGYRQSDPPFRISQDGIRGQQSSGFYSHWIRHANAQAFVVLWCIAWLCTAMRGARLSLLGSCAASLIGFGIIVLSGARGALMSFVGGAWLLALQLFSWRQVVVLTLVLVALLSAAISMASSDYQVRIRKALSGQDGRTYIWHTAWETFCRRPIMGVGDGGYDGAASDTVALGLSEAGPEGPRMGNAHNSILNALVLYGVPGLILWVGWLSCLVRHLWRSRTLNPAIWPLTVATLSVFLTGGLTEDLAGYASSRFQLLFGLAMALGIAIHAQRSCDVN